MSFRWIVRFALLASLPLIGNTTAMCQQTLEEGSFVYVMTNRAEGNSVLVYRRASNGFLTLIQVAPTKGLGTGFTLDPLESQGSLSLSSDGKLLLAVNPGSGDLTAFIVKANGLAFGSKVPSGGVFPVSVTAFGNLVYVLNQLGIANINGFSADSAGHLQHIAGSDRKLAGGALAQPAEVSFTPNGEQLLVTEKGTNLIDVFDVQGDGLASRRTAIKSGGHTPFGFAFGPFDSVIVSEAERRLPNFGSTSSYRLASGGLDIVSSKVPDQQTAACWVAITGQTAWVVNTFSSDISSYEIGSGATLSLLNPRAGSTGPNDVPLDIAASRDGKYVYVVKSRVGAVEGFRVHGNSLIPIFNKAGLPLSITGLVAR